MGGGLLQLVAYGAQDIYLTGNPQITFFKSIYKRYTNFSMESIQQTLNGRSASGVGGRVSATIARNGDLLYKTFIVLPPMSASGIIASEYGHQIIKSVEVEIGGQVIDRHYGDFMEAWAELTEPNPTGSMGYLQNLVASSNNLANTAFNVSVSAGGGWSGGYTNTARNASFILNQFTDFQRMACCGGVGAAISDVGDTDSTMIMQELYIPLRFWFCKEPGLALPLIALQYHEVNIIIDFSSALQHDFPELWCDYIYLDTDERRRFAQVSHEYLIEQLQVNSFTPSTKTQNYKLTFNHPVKELIWFCITNEWNTSKDNHVFAQLATAVDAGLQTFVLTLNGQDRFYPRRTPYFTIQQPYLYHTSRGLDRNTLAPVFYNPVVLHTDTIGVYSFALKPEEHQPSGTCNFSRIDSAILTITDGVTQYPSPILKVYAINYNILRIMSGMGGLAYSN